MRNVKQRKNGADGAYIAKNKLVQACEEVMSYLRLSGLRINGVSYGSEKLYVMQENKSQLYAMVCQRHFERFGHSLSATADEIALTYAGVRKGNYERLRDGKPIKREAHHPLFGIPTESVPVAVVYAYWGRNQIADTRLVKIGYTFQDLRTYLRSLERQYDPRLLATRCGGYGEEQAEHAKCRMYLEEGDEWYRPCPAIFAYLRRDWNLDPQFEDIVKEALAMWDAIR